MTIKGKMMRKHAYLILFFIVICASEGTHIEHYHHVEKGETLFSISKKYDISLKKLSNMNKLKSSTIHPGQKLLVKKIEKTSGKSSGKKSYSTVYVTRYYTVKKGDSLWKISRKLGISINVLKRLNKLKSSRLYPAQKLKYKARKKYIRSPIVKPVSIIKGSEKNYYTVKKGDSLSSIAKKFGVDTTRLKEANLLHNEKLKSGQILVIPSMEIISEETESETQSEENKTKISLNEKIIAEAFTFLNFPYKLGGNGKNGIDCSTLTKIAYRTVGVNLPNTSYFQYKIGIHIPLEEALPGDLIFFKRRKYIGHVGIYLGNKLFIHASDTQKKVTISSLENSYFKRHFAGIKRYLPVNELSYCQK